MKFMPQDVFEVFCLMLAEYKLIGDENFYNEIKRDMVRDHQSAYPGDALWLEQAESIVPALIKIVGDLGAKDKKRSLYVARDLRMKLDVNLNPISGLGKVFGGSFFVKSHPAPNMRAVLAIQNINMLYAKMAGAGFKHT